jgi:subtilase family serine protease
VGSNISVVSIDGANGSVSQGNEGNNLECDMDMQCVLGMAPLCDVIIYDDAGGYDVLGVVTQEADDNKADLVTESWGWWTANPNGYAAVHNVHLSMSAQGITYLCASGDYGTYYLYDMNPSYLYPDDDPEVLSVGGTSVTTDSAGNRKTEVVWNELDYNGGASGGGWATFADSWNVLPS